MPTARRRLADVAWLDQKMQLGFLRRKVARRQPTTSCTSRHTPMVQSSRVSEASELGVRRGHSRPPLRYVDCTQRALSLHRPECASQSRRDDPYAALPERPLDQLCAVDIFFGSVANFGAGNLIG